MSEQLQKKLLDFLDSLQSAGQDAYSFAEGEVPHLLREIIAYGLFSHGFLTLVFGVLVAACVYGIRWMLINVDDWNAEVWPIPVTMISGVATIVFGSVSIINALEFLKAWLAPRLYLIEQITELLQ